MGTVVVHREASVIFRELEVAYYLPSQGQLETVKGCLVPLRLSACGIRGSILTVFSMLLANFCGVQLTPFHLMMFVMIWPLSQPWRRCALL